MKFKHKYLTNTLKFLAEERDLKAEKECLTVQGVKPDLRIVGKDIFPIHVEIQSKGDGYKIKKHPANRRIYCWPTNRRAILIHVRHRHFLSCLKN